MKDSCQNQVLPHVNKLFANELRRDMNSTYIDDRVTDYFHQCILLIKKYGFPVSFTVGREAGRNANCSLIRCQRHWKRKSETKLTID